VTPEERADEEELRAALRAAGIREDDFGFFARDIPEAGIRSPRFDFETAAPVLVDCLPRVKTALVKERIVRSLTSEKAATPLALKPLIVEFRGADEHGLKWAIGNALATLADDTIAEELVKLAQDRRHGRSREMLMDALARTKDERALDALVELVNDDEVGGHAISAFRRLGPKSSLPYLERARPALERQAADGETPLARRQASAALERLS
jgi:HEAT repeat protein